MSTRPRLTRGGPELPYRLLAGIEPCPGGWLVVSGKLQGTTLAVQEPEVFKRFIDILDYRPSFAVMAIHLPLGLPRTTLSGGRTCDRDARRLLGWPRASAIASPPSWDELNAWRSGHRDGKLSVVTRSLMPRILEVYEHLGSYHQRTLFEVHPELSFYQLNDDVPLRYPKRSQLGVKEREDLLLRKLPGVDRVIQARLSRTGHHQLIDATADLWSARRIVARGVDRLPEEAEWDDQGLRMELQR